MKAIVAERGQVTIPKQLRDAFGIRPGTVLEFEARDGVLIARKGSAADRVRAVRGRLKALGLRTDEVIRRLRGEAE
jgi:AbrB family looped-hinge helix DNA binding protein